VINDSKSNVDRYCFEQFTKKKESEFLRKFGLTFLQQSGNYMGGQLDVNIFSFVCFYGTNFLHVGID